jgi:hypothetical protein
MKLDFLQTADDEFAAEVRRALGRVLQYPTAWTLVAA